MVADAYDDQILALCGIVGCNQNLSRADIAGQSNFIDVVLI